MNPLKKSKIWKKFLLSYSIFIILPLFVGLISYFESVDIIAEDTKNYTVSLLHQSAKMIDTLIDETDKISYQMAVNPQFNKFAHVRDIDRPSTYYEMWETLNYMRPFLSLNDANSMYNIYFKNSDMVVNYDGVYRLPEYYKYFGYRYKDVDEFREDMVSSSSNGLFMPSRKVYFSRITTTGVERTSHNVITYYKSLPLMSNSMSAMIFVQIREETILNFFNELDLSNGGFLYVFDKEDKLITGINSETEFSIDDLDFENDQGFYEQEIEGQNMYIIYSASSNNNWKYVAAIPSAIVMGKVNSIRNLILGVTFATFILGLIILVLLSYRYSKPIIELKKILVNFFHVEDNDKKDEFYFIEDSVSSLIRQNTSMQSNIEKQHSVLQKFIIERLLLGKNINNDVLKEAAQSGIDLTAKAYTCVLIDLNYLQLENIWQQQVDMEYIIHSQTGQKGYIIDVNATTLCLLLCFNTMDEDKCRQYTETVISWLRNQLKQSLNISPTFAIGSMVRELGQIFQSYNDARQVLAVMPIQAPSKLLWYSNLEIDAESRYFYPTELEQRLIHLVKGGYKEDIADLLPIVLEKNRESSFNSFRSHELLLSEIKGTIYKLNIANEENIVAQLDNYDSLEEVFDYLQTVLFGLCDAVNEEKSSENAELAEKIVSYVEENYSDSNLSLTQVATHFNYSEGYISQLFKKHTDEYFATYLENVRIAHACKLLEEKTYTIKEISLRTGYNSPQSFSRAFKRVKGINPTEYANQ